MMRHGVLNWTTKGCDVSKTSFAENEGGVGYPSGRLSNDCGSHRGSKRRSTRTWSRRIQASIRLFGLAVFLGQVLNQTGAASDLEVLSTDTRYGVDFDSSVVNVNVGMFDGSGVSATPVAGQLDASSWSFDGFSSVDDLSRGVSTGGVASGGLYAFDRGAVGESSNMLLGVQPTGTDFTPGNITLGVLNNSGESISNWEIDYEVFVFNNGDRSSSLNFSYAIGGGSFQDVGDLDFSTMELGDGEPSWLGTTRSTTLVAGVEQGEQLFLRWTSDDVSGTGSRDEFGLDNIGVKGVTPAAVPEPSHAIGLTLASSLGLLWRWRRRRNIRQDQAKS